MAQDTLTLPAPTAVAAADDSLGFDRELALQLARMPLYALLWVGAALIGHLVWAALAPESVNYAPLIVICVGMVLAAVVDGWAYKVPNWVTMPLILSGWGLGLLHSSGVAVDAGSGGFASALICTFLGFALLFPMLAIGGVGVGDVKMQMGFGAWVGAYFGIDGSSGLYGLGVVFWSFCIGAIVGGAFSMVMILIRRQFKQNATMVGEILVDLQLFLSGNAAQGSKRAQDRRDRWVKLPYGIPLCVGFLLFLWYALILNA